MLMSMAESRRLNHLLNQWDNTRLINKLTSLQATEPNSNVIPIIRKILESRDEMARLINKD